MSRTDIDITYFKERLLQEKNSLLAEISRIAQKNEEAPGGWEATPEETNEAARADVNEAADRLEDFEERRSTERELAKQLEQVERALVKIEEGTYGICDVSGESIETERLEANPAATTRAIHAQ
jgi:RNA polymerase-binding transcription factor DksA